MPSLGAHRYIDYLYLNKSYWKIHRAMDKPVKYLGRSHRVLFHDVISAVAIARYFYPGDPDAETAALLHIEFDTLCTADIFPTVISPGCSPLIHLRYSSSFRALKLTWFPISGLTALAPLVTARW